MPREMQRPFSRSMLSSTIIRQHKSLKMFMNFDIFLIIHNLARSVSKMLGKRGLIVRVNVCLQNTGRNSNWCAPQAAFPSFSWDFPSHRQIIWVFPKTQPLPKWLAQQQVQSRLFRCQALWELASCHRWKSRHCNRNTYNTFQRTIHSLLFIFVVAGRNANVFNSNDVALKISIVV